MEVKTKLKSHKLLSLHSVKERYFYSIGRRKTAVAQVRLFKDGSKKEILVNEKPLEKYFVLKKHQETAKEPFRAVGMTHYYATVKIAGGGLTAQAESIRLALSRALILINKEFRPQLKVLGYLKRDPRMVERKKYGLRKARRAQQWRKR